ncbi:tRNA 4-thiouridine(8) synthase ThiI [candidate division KSB1 bacterium]|nr:tRNA 4-thiouridine(8) synthase ThiI [candidate division KSB1 bacterium]
MNKTIIIHYSEIGLKKGNRGYFEHKLRDNILRALRDFNIDSLKIDFGRFVLPLPDDAPIEQINQRLSDVVGIAHFSTAFEASPDIDVLKEQVFEHVAPCIFSSFRVLTKRADKQYPLTSVEVNKIVGERIHTALNVPANMKQPDLTVFIEIYNKKVFFYLNRIQGLGGLPVTSSGKVVSLLSSGIDSPVASYRIMLRGCHVIFVHFHSFPFTDKASYHNAIELATRLCRFQYSAKIYLLPLAKLQEAIIAIAPPKLRLLLYRRAMFRLAEKVAKKEGAQALITGESLGQVASQTLENINAISEVVSLPVFRPLISFDKEVIVAEARKIGTYSVSIEPYDDCCSFLVPRNPETRAKIDDVRAAESIIENLTALENEILQSMECVKIQFPPE